MSDGLTVFQYDLLSALHQHDGMKGLAIKSFLELERDRYNGNVHHSRLYPNLDALVDRGLVEKEPRDKRTNEYTISERGVEVLRSRVRELGGDWTHE